MTGPFDCMLYLHLRIAPPMGVTSATRWPVGASSEREDRSPTETQRRGVRVRRVACSFCPQTISSRRSFRAGPVGPGRGVMGQEFGTASGSARALGRTGLSLAVAVVLALASVIVTDGLTVDSGAAGRPPAGEAVAGAVSIRRLPFATHVSTVELPDAGNGADCAGNGHAAWFSYQSRKATSLIANTVGSDFDTTLSAYTARNGSLMQLVCNDDALGSTGLQSAIAFDVAAGETVYILAASCCGQVGGNLALTVNEAATGSGGAGCTKRSSRSPSGRCGPAAAYYLAVGDSVPVWNGTDSYPDQILRSSVTRSVPGLKLVNVACSSETSATFIADSVCGGSQLARAVDFLKSNQGHVALITIDIGGNDVLPCAMLSGIDWE